MKKIYISIILFIVFILTVFGCGETNNKQNYVKNESEEARQALMDVYNCLLQGDKQKLKSVLCVDLQNQNDVDEQIDIFFDNIGGGIKSGNVDEISIMGLGKTKELYETDRYTIENTLAEMTTIIDNNGEEYAALRIGYYHYNKPEPGLLGIYRISLNEKLFQSTYSITHKDYGVDEQTEQERSVTELTQEQEKEISALEEKNHCMMPYRRAVASGDISPDSPKLTLDDTKRIIKEAENVESLNVRIYESGRYENYNQQAEYICQEISKIQLYADTIRSSGMIGSRELEYWLTSDETTGERKQIHLTSGGRMICYEEIDKDGKTKNSEVLFEASLEKNRQDSEEDYPVITRPIVPDSASAE